MLRVRPTACTALIALIILALAGGVTADELIQHEVVSPRIDAPPIIDGRLDEPTWARAALIEELVTLGAMVAPEHEHTTARVMHDDRALYIGVHCMAPGFRALPEDDGRIYHHERVEVFLDPTPATDDYYQIAVDRAGKVLSVRRGPAPGAVAPAWGEDLEVAVTEVEGGWVMEMAVPFDGLSVETPVGGEVYRLKVCRDGGPDGSLSWPPNPASSFHVREADGALYFEAMNLLRNGDFEEGDATGRHVPPPWSAGMTSPEVDNALQGTVETLDGAGVDGGRGVRMTKLISALWWPQIWSPMYELEPGGLYEFSLLARGDLPNINLRASSYQEGRRVVRLSQTFDVPAEWQRLRYYFVATVDAPTTSVGISAPNAISGEVFLDQAMLRRVIRVSDTADAAQPMTFAQDPDPVQGLDALMERHGHKPWDLYARGDDLLSRRTIFRDRQFGTEVWMLDDSPSVDHCGTASVWPAWNADVTLLRLDGPRPGPDGMQGGWMLNADYSRLLLPPAPGRPLWDRQNPDIYYVHRDGQLVEANMRTRETRVVAEWEPYPRERVYGLTRDNRYIFLDTPNGGMWVSYEPDENDPIQRSGLHDGRPEAPDEHGNAPHPRQAHNMIMLRETGGWHEAAETERWGPIFRIRVGLLIDRETGEIEPVIAPLSGQESYLRAFMSDRVNFPTGEGWEEYRLHRTDDLEEMFQISRYYPTMTHGHQHPSPDGEYWALDGGATRIIRTRDNDTRSLRLSSSGGNYHLHWLKHPRFFVGWVRGWGFVNYMRPHNANVEFQVFSDETFQPIVDTKHRFNGYYSGGDFSMLSPDATKIHYGSSMTGRFKNYIAVMARPRPPGNVTWEADGAAVVLNWEPSAYGRETRGHLVYRSERSGDGYVLLTPEPVEGTSWRDETVQAGQAYYYVVTSLEHSGLESGYSQEAARAGVNLPANLDAPLVVYAEAEDSIKDLYTDERPGLAVGVDRLGASDWQYIYRHPEAERGEAALAVRVPAGGAYHVWARVRSTRVQRTVWEIGLAGDTLAAATGDVEWTWVRAGDGPVTLPAGETAITLTTEDRNAELDLLCLVTDAAFTPQGPRPEKSDPPAAVGNLRAENIRERVNHLTWEPPDDPTLSHYQVYASRDPIAAPAQELLIGSPTDAELIDWGLQADVTYHYAVTAVDRRGNESALATAQAATPPGEPPVMIELTLDEAEREGPFEVSRAGGTRGESYVVAQDAPNNAAAWEVTVPRDGDYYLWLRYLHRGDGNRGGEVRQDVRVLLNGERVTSLGGGHTDLHVPDALIAPDHPLAPRLWTWARPGNADLERVTLPAGTHTLRLENFTPNVRYDALVITSEPSWVPQDGRLRQR